MNFDQFEEWCTVVLILCVLVAVAGLAAVLLRVAVWAWL